jgi:hypothetical protein
MRSLCPSQYRRTYVPRHHHSHPLLKVAQVKAALAKRVPPLAIGPMAYLLLVKIP